MPIDRQPRTVLPLLREEPIETLPELINEMEFALSPLVALRDHTIDEQWSDEVAMILGIYIRHMDQLVMKGRELVNDRQGPRRRAERYARSSRPRHRD